MLTQKAAEKLSEKLVDAYLNSAGLDGAYVGEQTKISMTQNLLKKCRESQIGFRLTMKREGELSIGMGTARNGDNTYETNGLLIFADQSSTAVLGTHQLDYIGSPASTFVLRSRV